MRIFETRPFLPADARGAVLAMGNFDGMHPGHRSVIEQARTEATRRSVPLGIIVLEPLPRQYFQRDVEPFRLTTRQQRRRLAAEMGVDLLIELTFDDVLAQQSDRDFCRDWVARDLGASCLVVGFDFNFGKGRAGNVESLRALGEEFGFDLRVTDQVADPNGDKASSSHIRDALKAGDVKLAAQLLGRPWEIEGVIENGEKRGRTLGFPTANVHLGELIHPKHGIYAVMAAAEDGVWRPGVANFGRTPTTGLRDPLLEVHFFDFDADLYGQTLRTQLIDYIRAEEKFDSLDDLVAAMNRDAQNARSILSAAS